MPCVKGIKLHRYVRRILSVLTDYIAILLAEKYFEYTDIMRSYVKTVLDRISEEFSAEETTMFSLMLRKISDDMMPEVKMTT